MRVFGFASIACVFLSVLISCSQESQLPADSPVDESAISKLTPDGHEAFLKELYEKNFVHLPKESADSLMRIAKVVDASDVKVRVNYSTLDDMMKRAAIDRERELVGYWKILTKYTTVGENEYILSLSIDDATGLGIPAQVYKNYVRNMEDMNNRVADALKSGACVTMLDPQTMSGISNRNGVRRSVPPMKITEVSTPRYIQDVYVNDDNYVFSNRFDTRKTTTGILFSCKANGRVMEEGGPYTFFDCGYIILVNNKWVRTVETAYSGTNSIFVDAEITYGAPVVASFLCSPNGGRATVFCVETKVIN